MKHFLGACVGLLVVSCSIGSPMLSRMTGRVVTSKVLWGQVGGFPLNIAVGRRDDQSPINQPSLAMEGMQNLLPQNHLDSAAQDGPQTPTEEEEQQLDLGTLQEVMKACRRVLRYFRQHVTQMNLDAVIGTRIAEAQFKMVLMALEGKGKKWTDVDGGWKDLLEWKMVVTSLRSLHLEASQLNSLAQPLIKSSSPEYYNELGNLLEPGFWEIPLSTKVFNITQKPLSSSSQVLDEVEQLEEAESDKCIGEPSSVSGGEDASIYKQCFLSQECWDLMTSPGYSGYSLTHQVLYLVIGLQAGCGDQEEQLAQSTLRNGTTMTVTTLLEQLCYSILNEANTIDQAGFPNRRRDLFMEQGAVCGLIGYRDFFKKQWLAKVLSWQRASGCYGDALRYYGVRSRRSTEGGTSLPVHARMKREERPMAGQCLAHISSVAVGYLSLYVRYLALAVFK